MRNGNHLAVALKNTKLTAVQTAIVSLDDLAVTKTRPHEIASILTASRCEAIYIVFGSSKNPRFEITDEAALLAAMRFIDILKRAGLRIIVSNASSDLLLWKAAGADDCATGKFFNLRRFTPGRFGDADEGGGSVFYWFEEALLAFLRPADFISARQLGVFSASSAQNPLFAQIVKQIAANNAWQALGWRQYLHWFADVEARLSGRSALCEDLINDALQNWEALRDAHVAMEEFRTNKGQWLEPWKNALQSFRNP